MLNFYKKNYPTEYNVYSGEGVFSSYRMAYAHTQKNYYIYNHLGSKAVEVDSVGNIIDYVQYNPFGDHTSTLLSAGGVRKYDYEIGRFTSVDPLWEKYTGWTGYQYSGNNPVNLVDRDGRVVIATDKASKDNIINSVEKPYRNLVAFNDNGVAYLKENPKLNPLMKDVQNLSNIGNFTNIGALQYLVNHKDVIEVSQNKYINFEQTEGENSGIYNSYNLDGDRANGATLLKSSTNESVVSLKNVHQVIVSPNQFTGLSGPATKGSTTAHELYGHLFLYLWGQNGWGTPYYRGHEGETRKHIIKAEQNSK